MLLALRSLYEAEAAGAFVLDTAVGSFALTGRAADLVKSASEITPDLTRFAWLLRGKDYRIAAHCGTFALTGISAELHRGRVIVAGGRTLKLSQPSWKFRRSYRVTPVSARFTSVGGSSAGEMGLSDSLRKLLCDFADANQGMSGPPTNIGIYWEPKTSKWVMREEKAVLEVMDEEA